MPAPEEITDLLSWIGVPAAVALAAGLVRGARALEEEASEPALQYVSSLLVNGGVAGFGKIGATLIPAAFDRVFGPRPFSYKFVSRSVLASSLLWLILLAMKNPSWIHVLRDLYQFSSFYAVFVPAFYVLDWISPIKARTLIRMISRRYALISTITFCVLNVLASLTLTTLTLFAGALISITATYLGLMHGISLNIISDFPVYPISVLTFTPLMVYIFA